MHDKYEITIGLEVHIQLLTKSKVYCSDSTEYGAIPNTQAGPVSLGHPGTLPVLNEKVVEFAVRLGVACGCDITRRNEFARKNYFYADLPKGYQITQHLTPICTGGYIPIKGKHIGLTTIHMEEDTGKSIHDIDPVDTLINLNRAGVPLLEMVTQPVIANSDEAVQYLTELRRIVRYLGICDGDMEKGSMRCDANVSVRIKGSPDFGTKVEVKNMNSISHVKNAIEYEFKRQVEIVENGGSVQQETRKYNAETNTTSPMRSKENADDYRYFPEPDLTPVILTDDFINKIKRELPPLPEDLRNKYTGMGLSEYNVGILTEDKETALYFEKLTRI